MNTLLSLLALSCLCGLSTALFGKGFFSGEPPVTKRDCQWMAWGAVGRCTPRGHGWFAGIKTRRRVSATNGGKDCEGSYRRYVTCTELEYVASTFLDAVTTQSRAKDETNDDRRIIGGFFWSRPVLTGVQDLNPCTTPFTDAAGNFRMLGKPCQTRTRRIRSANGNIKVYEEPLRESSRVKRQTPKPMKHRDMLFLIDESGSVTPTNFKKEVRLARAIIGNLCGSISVGNQGTRIGILGFDSTQHPMLDFDQLFKKAQIFTHMDTNVTYTSSTRGSTCLNNALEFSRTKMFHKDRGARMNSGGVEQTIVLITDGCANCADKHSLPTTLKDMRLKLEFNKISIIVYFIGEIGSCKDLMLSLLSGGRCYELFTATSWAELDAMSAYIEDIKGERKCTDSWQNPAGEGAPSCA